MFNNNHVVRSGQQPLQMKALQRGQTTHSRKSPEDNTRINSDAALPHFSANSYYSNNTQGHVVGPNNTLIRNMMTNPSSKDKNE